MGGSYSAPGAQVVFSKNAFIADNTHEKLISAARARTSDANVFPLIVWNVIIQYLEPRDKNELSITCGSLFNLIPRTGFAFDLLHVLKEIGKFHFENRAQHNAVPAATRDASEVAKLQAVIQVRKHVTALVSKNSHVKDSIAASMFDYETDSITNFNLEAFDRSGNIVGKIYSIRGEKLDEFNVSVSPDGVTTVEAVDEILLIEPAECGQRFYFSGTMEFELKSGEIINKDLNSNCDLKPYIPNRVFLQRLAERWRAVVIMSISQHKNISISIFRKETEDEELRDSFRPFKVINASGIKQGDGRFFGNHCSAMDSIFIFGGQFSFSDEPPMPSKK